MQIVIERLMLLDDVPRQPGEIVNVDDKIGKLLLDRGVAYPARNPLLLSYGPQFVPGLVSCIMPTKNRRQWVPRAIECFLAQTYEARELIVLDNGEPIADILPSDPRIRYIRMAGDHKIGNLRNFCCQMAKGEFIAHWDDDDWSHPERIAEQVAAIGEKQITAYRSMVFHGPGVEDLYLYSAPRNCAVGSSFLYRKNWWNANRFPPQHVGEDAGFMKQAASVALITDNANRMVASTHKENTSPRCTRAKEWKKVSVEQLPEGYQI